jgi:hypothetical protein
MLVRRSVELAGMLVMLAAALAVVPQRGKAADVDPVLVVNGLKKPVPVTLTGGTGTANVNVTNQPTVSVAPGTSVGVNGTVNTSITNTPNVNVMGLPAVQLAAGANVGINGTPNVNVANQPTVSLAPGASMTVSNRPGEPLTSIDVNNPAREPATRAYGTWWTRSDKRVTFDEPALLRSSDGRRSKDDSKSSRHFRHAAIAGGDRRDAAAARQSG